MPARRANAAMSTVASTWPSAPRPSADMIVLVAVDDANPRHLQVQVVEVQLAVAPRGGAAQARAVDRAALSDASASGEASVTCTSPPRLLPNALSVAERRVQRRVAWQVLDEEIRVRGDDLSDDEPARGTPCRSLPPRRRGGIQPHDGRHQLEARDSDYCAGATAGRRWRRCAARGRPRGPRTSGRRRSAPPCRARCARAPIPRAPRSRSPPQTGPPPRAG